MPSFRRVIHRLASPGPLAPPGVGLLVAGGGIVLAGRAGADLVLTLAGSVVLAALALLGGASLLAAILLRRRFRRALEEVPGDLRGESGRPVPTGLRLRQPRVPLAGEGRIRWERPPGESRFPAGEERFFAPDRCLVAGAGGRVTTGDVLGAFRWNLPVTAGRRIHLLPPRPGTAAESLLEALASGDLLPHPEGPREGDRVDSRPYAPGDPARLILWKAWARRRELLVRSPEQALAPREDSILLCLVAGPGDGDAAGVARLLAEELLPAGNARFAADGSPAPVEELEEALAAISRSAHARDRSGEVLEQAVAARRRGEAVLVVCPAHPPPDRERLLGAAAEAGGGLAVLAVGRTREDPRPPGRFRRWLLREPRPGPTRADLVEGLAPLARDPAVRVSLADLRTGEVTLLATGGAGG